MTTASHTPGAGRPGDDAPSETVTGTGRGTTIRVSGKAAVFTAQVQDFILGGMPGRGKSGAVRWHMVQATPEIAETSDD